MIRNLKKLILRAFPELGGRHVSRLGVVVAIADPPGAEKASDRFRPRYAADVRLLTPRGEPDDSRPMLEGLPLPANGAGDGRGDFAFPGAGTRVRIGYDYGLPSHPYIAAILPQGGAIPAVQPGEKLRQHSEGNYDRFDAKGNYRLQTDGEIRQDSNTRLIVGDEAVEQYGKLTRTVEGNQDETTGGKLERLILGALIEKIGGDARRAVLGGEDVTTGGDFNRLTGGNYELAAQQGATLKANLGNMLVEAIAGTATFKAAVKIVLDSIAIDLVLGAVEPVILGNLFKTFIDAHVHSGGTISGLTGAPTLGLPASVLSTKVKVG